MQPADPPVASPIPPVTPPFEAAPALVVFVGDTALTWLTVLRSGFRHCFVAVESGNAWILCDPLSHRTDLVAVSGLTGADLAAWYRSLGLVVVETTTRPTPPRLAPVRPYTCVEAVKRVIGIHAPWVLTPWQLYRFLTDDRGSNGLDSDRSRNIYL